MNIIYFTMKNLNENRAFLAMLGFLLVFGCKSEDNGNGDATKVTLSITKPTNGTLSSNAGGISCGSEDNDCKAEFSKDSKVTLTATADKDYAPAAWQGACDKTEADQPCKLSMDANKSAGKAFSAVDTDGDEVPDVDDVDDDNDGLMEIHNLDMFNHIRYSLAGTSYKNSDSASDNRKGAPEAETDNCTTATESFYLCGYELARDLDFAEGASYAGGSVNAGWRPDDDDTSSATNEGFSGASHFAGIFEGNEHSISNLYSRSNGARVGLFRSTTSGASIRNLGVVDANLYGNSGANQNLGALVGWNQGSIHAVSATGGTVNNDSGRENYTGGLVGWNDGGTITASSVTDSTINGSSQNSGSVGGLVGYMDGGTNTITASYVKDSLVNGNRKVGGLVGTMGPFVGGTNSIIASYATGAVNGGAGDNQIGGLVGFMDQGTNTITASFATGATNGGAGSDFIGGLVGFMNRGTNTITASYAAGAVNGGAGDDTVGGLVGDMDTGTNSITASFATGDPNGDVGNDTVGALVGEVTADGMGTTNAIVPSYAFGTPANDDTTGNPGTAHPAGLTGSGAAKANTLTKPPGGENTDANAEWDQAASKTKDAWEFGTNSQAPALKYADYDGPGASSVDYCALFPDKIPGTDDDLECGTSLLPDQPGR